MTASDAEEAVFVAAAGNYHDDSDSIFGGKFYPAANDHVIGVMNCEVGEDGAVLHVAGQDKGSNYGSAYEVCAPGTDIMSADGGNMGYKTLTGTSMASPVVSFAVALLRTEMPRGGLRRGRRGTARDVPADIHRHFGIRRRGLSFARSRGAHERGVRERRIGRDIPRAGECDRSRIQWQRLLSSGRPCHSRYLPTAAIWTRARNMSGTF